MVTNDNYLCIINCNPLIVATVPFCVICSLTLLFLYACIQHNYTGIYYYNVITMQEKEQQVGNVSTDSGGALVRRQLHEQAAPNAQGTPESGTSSQSMYRSHQTPAGSDHPCIVTSRSTVKRRSSQTSNDASSSGDIDGDIDGDDSFSPKKPHSELNPATASPVKNENDNMEEKSMTDQPLPTHEWEQVSSPHSLKSGSSSVPSPHPEDFNSDTEQYGTSPPVSDFALTTTSTIASESSTNLEKGSRKPPDFSSNPLSDTSQPNSGAGAKGGAGTGPDNQQGTKIQKVGVLYVIVTDLHYTITASREKKRRKHSLNQLQKKHQASQSMFDSL